MHLKIPPEIQLLKHDRSTPVDKIDVFTLGSILEELVIKPLSNQTDALKRQEAQLIQDLKGGLIDLKNQIEKEKYEERLDIEDIISMVGYFILFLRCHYNKEKIQFLQQLLSSVEQDGNEQDNNPCTDNTEFPKNFILVARKRTFSVEEKIITEIVLARDLARALLLVRTRLPLFYQQSRGLLDKLQSNKNP